MQTVTEKPIDPKRLDFSSLPELPRQFGLVLTDLGFTTRGEYLGYCTQAAKGSKEAQKKLDVVREVLFELMKRDREQRVVRDDFGEIPTVAVMGVGGQQIRTPVIEYVDVSKWDVRDEGGDCHVGGAGPGRVKPRPGHWYDYVKTHWVHLAPLLLFREADVAPPQGDPRANPATYARTVANAVSDTNPVRYELLKWLKPFIEAGRKSDWEGK